jgi:hypothetical protein
LKKNNNYKSLTGAVRAPLSLRFFPVDLCVLLALSCARVPGGPPLRVELDVPQAKVGEVVELGLKVKNQSRQYVVLAGARVEGPGVRQLLDPTDWCRYVVLGAVQDEGVEYLMILPPGKATATKVAVKFLQSDSVELKATVFFRVMDFDTLRKMAFAHTRGAFSQESLSKAELVRRVATHQGVSLRGEPLFGSIAYGRERSGATATRAARIQPAGFSLADACRRAGLDAPDFSRTTFCRMLGAWVVEQGAYLWLLRNDSTSRLSSRVSLGIFDYLDAAGYVSYDTIVLVLTNPKPAWQFRDSVVNGVGFRRELGGPFRYDRLGDVESVLARLSAAMEAGTDVGVDYDVWPGIPHYPPPSSRW